MVIGLDWMERHNPIGIDLKTREINVHVREDTIVVKALKEDKIFQLIKGNGV